MNNKNVQNKSVWFYKALFYIVAITFSHCLCAETAGSVLQLPSAPGLKLTLASQSNPQEQQPAPAAKPKKAKKTAPLAAADKKQTANLGSSASSNTATDQQTDDSPTAGKESKANDGSKPGSTSDGNSNTDDMTTAENDAESTDSDSDPVPDDAVPTQVNDKDSLEGFNRAMFTFNDKLDTYFLKPIATLYNKIMPKPLNKGIHNAYENINTIPTIVNDLLQANFFQAANDTWRLGINSTIGVVGIFDIAERMQLEPYDNDFGLTLARWGYADSSYLVLPFFGPNTIRDGIFGLPVDYFAFSVYPYINPPSTRYQVYALGVIDRRAQLLKLQDVLEEASYDKYVFMRNAYLQRRAYQVEQNNHRSCCDRMADGAAVTASPAPATDENYD